MKNGSYLRGRPVTRNTGNVELKEKKTKTFSFKKTRNGVKTRKTLGVFGTGS
jgi:hypothetical protein